MLTRWRCVCTEFPRVLYGDFFYRWYVLGLLGNARKWVNSPPPRAIPRQLVFRNGQKQILSKESAPEQLLTISAPIHRADSLQHFAAKTEEEFSYVTSGFVRTNETANQISKGRGEATLPKLITNHDITGNWFLKISADSLAKQATALGLKGSSIELMAHWAYEGGYPETFYEMEPRAQE